MTRQYYIMLKCYKIVIPVKFFNKIIYLGLFLK